MRLGIMLFAMLLLLGGCATRQTFDGYSADQVWTAMVAVANTPDYKSGPPNDRWIVRENRVWVDDQSNRIEIFRRLERVLYQPASKPDHQDREWKMQVVLEDRDPPRVMFRSRNWGVPSHAWDESDRFFAEVRDILGAGDATTGETSEQAAAKP